MEANNLTLEKRVEVLEREFTAFKSRFSSKPQRPWWEEIVGIFENDPAFDEIVALGKAIREKDRPEDES